MGEVGRRPFSSTGSTTRQRSQVEVQPPFPVERWNWGSRRRHAADELEEGLPTGGHRAIAFAAAASEASES
jgi:hypothetical protein